MTRTRTTDTRKLDHLPEHDQELIRRARGQRREQIEEDEAWTDEARQILHDMISDKYHQEEYRNGIL